nr:E-beta-farnesene synthase [Tanacetum cinerariifolium]
MRNKEAASWDLGKRTWGGREIGFGTVLVLAGVQEEVQGSGEFWREKRFRGTVWVVRVWSYGKFSPPGRRDNVIDEDVDEQHVQDLALNVDNVFQADDCDAFDSNVDEAPMTQNMFMANLSSADHVYDEAGLSYDLDILSESKHKFHPRPDSPLHFPNEEPILGYLKFSAKGTKREVFRMPIPGNLITTDIQGEPDYKEYLEKVANHQRYLAGKKRSDPDSPVPKPVKATKKSKPSAPKADLRPPITKPASSQQPEPKPTSAKSQGKKRKLVTKTSDKPSLARRSKPGLVTKRHKPTSSLRSIDEFVDEGVPKKEPRFDDEEADVQRALEEKKGKEKVTDEQVAFDLLTLQTLKKKSHVDQFIFQRHTSTPIESFGHDESSSLYAELRLTDKEPASLIGTLSSLRHLAKDLSFGDLFFNDKPSEADNEKTTTETEAKSIVYVTIQQDTCSITPMKTPIIDLTSRHDSPNVHRPLQARATETTTTTTITHPPPPQPQQSTTNSMLIKHISELEQIMANLIQDNNHLEERLDSQGARLYTLENLDIPQQVRKAVDEIVTDAVDWAI